jgi:hypothetical protein
MIFGRCRESAVKTWQVASRQITGERTDDRSLCAKMVSPEIAAALSSPLSVIEEIYARSPRSGGDALERQVSEHFRDLLKDRIDEVQCSSFKTTSGKR